MNKFLLGLLGSAGLLYSATSMAQCVVSGTNFDTETQLCNPSLSNDENGWFSKDLTDLLKAETTGCTAYSDPSNITQIGVTTGKLQIPGEMITPEAWEKNAESQTGTSNKKGYSAIVSNPKLISPLLSEGSGNNMLVNFGTSHDSYFVMGYSVSGLKPNSKATFTCDVYNLLDNESLAAYAAANNERIVRACGINYDAANDAFLGTTPAVTYSTVLGSFGMESPLSSDPIEFGGKISLTFSATADENGVASFYIGRKGGTNSLPIGIDNIQIEGVLKPSIRMSGIPCPMQPVLLTSRIDYPEGTTYSWKESVTGEVATTQNFYFTPNEANATYNVSLEIAVPGCDKYMSDEYTIQSKNCCQSGDGVPMGMTYLFYDDFGNFVSNDTYEWTDRTGVVHTETIPEGQVHEAQALKSPATIPYVRAYNIEASGALLTIPCLSDDPTKSELFNHGVYVVSKYGGYPGGVKYDNSGTTTGGMLQFDLADDGSQNDFFEFDIDNICVGKALNFGVDVASISSWGGSVEVSFELNGTKLIADNVSFVGSDGWNHIGDSFVIEPGVTVGGNVSIKMKIRNLYNTSVEGGDYAIDNIFVSVCTPPDIMLTSDLTANELLDLCTDKPLVLETKAAESAKLFYSEIGYLFQYTYSDPSTTDLADITWYDLSEIQENNAFEISNPATHNAFAPLASGEKDRIYFRVLMGNQSDLKIRDLWEHYDAFSPCRVLSYSTTPVVAGLSCATCVAPDAVEFAVEGGTFDKAKKTVTLNVGESAKIGLVNPAHGLDEDNNDFFDYQIKWFAKDINSDAIVTKNCNYVDNEAPTITVDYADAENTTGVEYIISIHNNFDPAQSSTPCDITDTITVIAKLPSSVSNAVANTATISPNPASTKINVNTDGAIEKVEIINMLGEVVKVSDKNDINVSNLSNGVYFIRTTINGENTVHKLVINK